MISNCFVPLVNYLEYRSSELRCARMGLNTLTGQSSRVAKFLSVYRVHAGIMRQYIL